MDHPHITSIAEKLVWSGSTHRGKVRKNNEDSFLGLQFDAQEVHHLGKVGEASLSEADLAFAVSDGMGGANAGELASRLAIEKITRLLPRSFRQSAIGMPVAFVDVMTELFSQIHRALQYVGSSYNECDGMETTLSLCWFTRGKMFFGHVGDSRIYCLPAGGGLKQITQDDTHVGWLLRTGAINEREARNHPRRRMLQKALGGNNQFVDPQVGVVSYEPGDMFLICSDGLVEGLRDEHLAEYLHSPKFAGTDANLAQWLVEESVAKDGGDNTTALVIRAI